MIFWGKIFFWRFLGQKWPKWAQNEFFFQVLSKINTLFYTLFYTLIHLLPEVTVTLRRRSYIFLFVLFFRRFFQSFWVKRVPKVVQSKVFKSFYEKPMPGTFLIFCMKIQQQKILTSM